MSRYAVLHAIERLDPEKDHQRIIFLSTCYDFPFDTTRALEFALFRTFCVPSISALLDRTGEFSKRPQKRYDDTDIIVSELEPIRWNERFGWRLLCEEERLGYFYFWREVGGRMNIRDIPSDYQVFERFNRDYERQHYRFTEANRRVGGATRELFVSWFPSFLAPVVRSTIYALLDDRLIESFGFPQSSRLMRWLVPGALRLRAGFARLLPPDRKPRLRTEMGHPTYPDGYVIEHLGPPDTNPSLLTSSVSRKE